MKQVDLSCIILSWNSSSYLEGCLNSLEKDFQGSDLTYEAIVIDNGSSDSSLEILESFQRKGFPLVVVPLGKNTGTTFSRNIGMRMARGAAIAILDSDIEFFEPKTMERLLDILHSQPRIGILAPKLRYRSGRHQKSVDEFPTLYTKLKRLFFLRKMEKLENMETTVQMDLREVHYAISAFWLFRSDLLNKVGYLDEKIFYAPEDVDFCLRSWLNGLPVYFCNTVRVTHLAQEISRKKPFSKSALMHVQGLCYYFLKYKYMLSLRRINKKIHQAVATRRAWEVKSQAANPANAEAPRRILQYSEP